MLKLFKILLLFAVLTVPLKPDTLHAQVYNRLTKYWKYGLSMHYIASEKLEFLNIDADKITSTESGVPMYGLFVERIFYDEFGFGFTLVKGSRTVDFDVNTSQRSTLKVSSDIYHGLFNFVAYTNKNRSTGILFGFEAALGVYYTSSKLKSDRFYYTDRVSGLNGAVDNFSEELTAQFISSSFLGKIDLRFKGSGIRLSAGFVTGGSFEKVKFNVPQLANQGVIGIRNTLNKSPIITLDIYAFD